MFQKEHAQVIKKTISESGVNAWKYVQKKSDDIACIYVVCKVTTSSQVITSILDEHPQILFVKFLKGLGKGN